MADGNYEVDDAQAKSTLRSISDKIKGALKPGWGFILMLFEYNEKPGGALFYASSAERPSSVKVVREWLEREELRAQEVNPDNKTTAGLRGQWHKIVAMLLAQQGPGAKFTIAQADLDWLAAHQDQTVAARDSARGLELWIVDGPEARRLAREEEGRLRDA